MTSSAAPPAIAADLVGTVVGPVAHEIDARWLMAYAAALRERAPGYFDTLSARGPQAHPLFAVCYEWPAALALRERVVPAALRSRGVHATHRLIIHRAPRAGDRLRTTGRVTSIERRRSGTLVVGRFETVDAGGDPVTTTEYGSVYRGVAPDGAGDGPGADRPAAVSSAAAGSDIRWTAPVQVDANAAWVYTECARIWNPIHTDVAVARAAGLPAPILHGTATLALAVSRVLERETDGDPVAVAEVSARFTGMVAMPSTLAIRGRERHADAVDFDAIDDTGAAVLAAGRLRFRRATLPSSKEP